MKKFFTDYKELLQQNKQFYKKHWFGTIVLNVVGCAIGLAVVAAPAIKDSIEEKIDQKKRLNNVLSEEES